jgi:hypothetical protein
LEQFADWTGLPNHLNGLAKPSLVQSGKEKEREEGKYNKKQSHHGY